MIESAAPLTDVDDGAGAVSVLLVTLDVKAATAVPFAPCSFGLPVSVYSTDTAAPSATAVASVSVTCVPLTDTADGAVSLTSNALVGGVDELSNALSKVSVTDEPSAAPDTKTGAAVDATWKRCASMRPTSRRAPLPSRSLLPL